MMRIRKNISTGLNRNLKRASPYAQNAQLMISMIALTSSYLTVFQSDLRYSIAWYASS